MAKRMQHCFYCGEELGVFDSREPEACSDKVCQRELHYLYQEEECRARYEAERDNYDRYR